MCYKEKQSRVRGVESKEGRAILCSEIKEGLPDKVTEAEPSRERGAGKNLEGRESSSWQALGMPGESEEQKGSVTGN